MANKQTRRTVSLSRPMFEAARKLAADRGQTLSHFVETALVAAGVQAEIGVHMTRQLALHAQRSRAVNASVVMQRAREGLHVKRGGAT